MRDKFSRLNLMERCLKVSAPGLGTISIYKPSTSCLAVICLGFERRGSVWHVAQTVLDQSYSTYREFKIRNEKRW